MSKVSARLYRFVAYSCYVFFIIIIDDTIAGQILGYSYLRHILIRGCARMEGYRTSFVILHNTTSTMSHSYTVHTFLDCHTILQGQFKF